MTNTSKSPDNDLPFGLLESKWPLIQSNGNRIADEIDIKSEGLSGNARKQAMLASDFFRSSASYESALNRPNVLVFANPLARLASGTEISQSHLSTAAHLGFCTLSRHGSNQRNLFRIFLYPILLTLFFVLGSVLAAFFLLTPFEQLFTEFGIAVPWITRTFFFLGYVVRTYVVSILVVVFGLPPLLWLFNWIGQSKRQLGMSRLDVMFSRKRAAASRWLLHLSLLIESGMPNETAMQKASLRSGKRWINRCLARHDGSNQEAGFFDQVNLRMADTAIVTPRSRAQVALLQQVATWYRDTSTGVIEWFVQLLTPLMIAMIFITFFLLIACMLMPLGGIISGLTGGGGPGGFM